MDAGKNLVEVCLESQGRSADSQEHELFTAFRETCLEGRQDFAEHEHIGQTLAQNIGGRKEGPEILARLYMTLAQPCLYLIERGQVEEARELYYGCLEQLWEEYGK